MSEDCQSSDSDSQLGSAHLETQAVRAGKRTTHEREHSDAIMLSSSFMFDSAEDASGLFQQGEPGNMYSRFNNPTVRAFEDRLAALEGGERAIATASGMSAITLLMLTVLESGDHVVAAKTMFGSTLTLLSKVLSKFGITYTVVDIDCLDAWEKAIQPNTRLLFLESPTNPCISIGDIRGLSALAHQHNALLAVDNCFCTPALQRPLALGADVVTHSATKFLDGQGRAIGGAIVGSQALIGEQAYTLQRTLGFTMGAFEAWIFQKGLETLPIRMAKHCENAQALAEWLSAQPAVNYVNYLGLTSHPQHELAKTQQSGFGGVLSFEVNGGREAAWQVIDAVEMISRTANLGDTRTTITHPATTTHGRLTDEQRAAAGISEGLIRVSVGLEHVDDIQQDLQKGLSI